MKTPQENQAELMRAFWILGAFHSLVGVAVGAVLGAFVIGPWLVAAMKDSLPDVILEHPRVAFGMLGAFVGGTAGLGKAYQSLRAQSQRRARAESLGLSTEKRAVAETDAIEDDVRQLFATDTFLEVHPVAHRETPFGTLTIADVQRTSGGGSTSSEHTSHREQIKETVAHLEVRDVRLSRFALQPVGRVSKWLSGLFGQDHSEALDDAELSRRYHLSAEHPELVAALLTKDVRRSLQANPDWDVRSASGCLVLSHPRETVSAEELDGFIEEALALASQFLDAARKAPALPEPAARTIGDDPELDAFLEERAPRSVPAGIRRRVVSSSLYLPMVVGSVFVIGGTAFCVLGSGDATAEADRPLFVGLGATIATVGAVIAGGTFWYRRSKLRLLRHGLLATGHIEKIERTSLVVNNERRYRATIRFSADGPERVGMCNLYGATAKEAEARAEDGRPTRVLYDYDDPTKVVWEGSLAQLTS